MKVTGLCGQPVDVRRAGVLIAGIAAGVVTELVGEHIDEVRPFGRRGGRTEARSSARKKSSTGSRHLPNHLLKHITGASARRSSSPLRAARYPAFTIGIRCATGGSAGKSVYGVL
jgi:hypothetical protein